LITKSNYLLVGLKAYRVESIRQNKNGDVVPEKKFVIEVHLKDDSFRAVRQLFQTLDGGRHAHSYYDRIRPVHMLKGNRLRPVRGIYLVGLKSAEIKSPASPLKHGFTDVYINAPAYPFA